MNTMANMGTMGLDELQTTFHETSVERDFRKAANFPDCEKSMSFPLISKRGLGWKTVLKPVTNVLPASITSLAGSIWGKLSPGVPNPFAKKVDGKKHEVWLLDNTAYQKSAGGPWQATFTAAYFEYDSGEVTSEVIGQVAKLLNIADDEVAKERIASRLEPFVTKILYAHYTNIDLCSKGKQVKLSASNDNGISKDTIVFPGNWEDGQTCESTVPDVEHSIPCSTTFATVDGWAVISDIDDTIKVTGTGNPVEVVRNTFLEDSTPVQGMPEVYQYLKKRLDNPPFWYVSASPYVLYPFLHAFRKKNYPDGPMQLRETTLTNIAGLFMALTAGVQEFKVNVIEKIYTGFPKRKMICIGDSTQSDPESYAELYKKHPGWVAGIFIRNVIGQDGDALESSGKNKPERFEKAFEGIPKDDWYVFTEANELPERIDALMKRHGA